MARKPTPTIPPAAYQIRVIQVLGDMHWYLTPYRDILGYSGSPSMSGKVDGRHVHTERIEEVLSYIANEIGATLG